MRIDLNADVGEGFGAWSLGDDEALLGVVTSANVACGFHAGDPLIMRRTCAHAAANGVAVGAQVGYRDLAGFGRRTIEMPADALTADVLYQLGALHACAGALYHRVADDPIQAAAVCDAIVAFDPTLSVLGPPHSQLAAAAADHGLRFVVEGYADRAYGDNGRLVPRGQPGAVLIDPAAVTAQAVGLARDGRVRTVTGAELSVPAESISIHGDTPGAVGLARAVRAALVSMGVAMQPFTA